MPSSLKRRNQTSGLHFITFSCDDRLPYLNSREAKEQFERSLEATRIRYGLFVLGYVVMPEHIHLLTTAPKAKPLGSAIQALKQSVSRKLKTHRPFWLTRGYDVDVFSDENKIEKLRYMHRNPVVRGLVAKPEQWPWSSFLHYRTGERGTVEIESWWTQAKRDGLTIPEKFLEEVRRSFIAPHPTDDESVRRMGHPE